MKTTFLSFSLLLSGFFTLQAQSSIHTSGDDYSGSNGNIASSVGQIFYETVTSSSGSVSVGVQQSYEITETLGADITEIGLSLKVYPNPTPDILYLKIGFNDYKKYRYELFDNSGRLLTAKPINENQTSIAMGSYVAAVYLLKITKGGKVVKVFKVLKTDK